MTTQLKNVNYLILISFLEIYIFENYIILIEMCTSNVTLIFPTKKYENIILHHNNLCNKISI